MARPATAAVRLLTGEREPVRLATTGDISLYGLPTIDGVLTNVGDRVLVKNQTDARKNGIYTASSGQWYRAADARTSRTMQKGTTVHVSEGAVSADFVYAFQALDPVIGTDAITLAFYLSEDTLGDAVNAAGAAAASAAAALTSKNAAAISATNASTSASTAAGSATAASGSASTAATSATNAGTSGSAAAGSATAASGSATAASGSATAAATSATNAATSATSAAASASSTATSVAALGYTFSTTTTDADPGNGTLRLNNASAALATAAYVDNLDAGGATVSGMLDTFDDSTNIIKGQLTLRSKANAAISYAYNVTGAVVDGTGYRKLTLGYISGGGTLPTTANGIWLMFDRAGDKGADGTGAGDVTGPATSAYNGFARFNGTTGKIIKDGGAAVDSIDIADKAVSNTKMADMATARVKGRANAATGAVEDLTLTQVLDMVGSAAQGDILYRGATSWQRLAAGTSLQAMRMNAGATAPEWAAPQGGREVLTAARIYYVRTDGSDSNNGLANTVGGAFLTIAKAAAVAQSLDNNGFAITVSVADGTYTAGASLNSPLVGNGLISIIGNATTPANCVINATSANVFSANYGATITVKGFKCTTTTAGSILYALYGGTITFDRMDFGSCAGPHITASDRGEVLSTLLGSYTISGSAVSHIHAYQFGEIVIGYTTITVTGTPAFSAYFCGNAGSFINFEGTTFSGAATGQRFVVHKNGMIDTNLQGFNYFPGSIAGVIRPGSQYDFATSLGPVTKTTDFAIADGENDIIVNRAALCTGTFPSAANYVGREIFIKTIGAFAVVSASANIIPLVGGAASTAILAATAGKWAKVKSDGTNWIIMAAN